ncbi:MAG: hypothetical protein LBN11_08410 [Tannerella sp.]|jgi:hypothetical protein|nr:hypothetical protein [Tannerella sp.]
MEDSKEVAAAIIHRLGGSKRVKRMLIISRRYFQEFTLPETIQQCYPVPPIPDKDVVCSQIIEVIKSEGKPDTRQTLLNLKEQLESMIDSIDNLLFYNG